MTCLLLYRDIILNQLKGPYAFNFFSRLEANLSKNSSVVR
jgi:hypothetical protein